MSNSRKYYILSLKWTRGGDNLVFWGPSDSGYVVSLELAGKYTHEQVTNKAYYYNNLETTLAIPVEDVEHHAVRVVPEWAFRHFTRGRKYIRTSEGIMDEIRYAEYQKEEAKNSRALQFGQDGVEGEEQDREEAI